MIARYPMIVVRAQTKFICQLFAVGVLFTLAEGCSTTSSTFPTLQTMLINASSQFPAIWKLVTAAAYLMGVAFILRGVYQLKVYGDLRTMMSTQTNLKQTLIVLIVGTVLMYIPTAFRSAMMSTFGTTVPEAIPYQSQGDISGEAMNAIMKFVQLIGIISFIRGWIYLTHASNPGGHSSFGKGITHIIGGLLAVNIEGTKEALQATTGVIS